MTVSYSPGFVVASVMIAIWASFAAMTVSERIWVSRGRARTAWTALAAVCLGGGIWSMHFVAMLALHVHGPGQEETVSYNVPITLLSLVLPILASLGGFWAVHRRRSLWPLAGIIFGTAIVVMHYTGMWAMELPARQVYSRALVALSYAIAIGASLVALRISLMHLGLVALIAAGIVMGFAISGMHYIGMRALTLVPYAAAEETLMGMTFNRETLGIVIAAVTLLLVNGSIIAASYDSLIRKPKEPSP